jgi:hypothetical protein
LLFFNALKNKPKERVKALAIQIERDAHLLEIATCLHAIDRSSFTLQRGSDRRPNR